MSTYTLYNDDCLEVLKSMSNESIDSVVTDPPYGISFMGKGWDYDVPKVEIWSECLRVLKPGGHLLAFAGTRTQHRMAVAIEDAGFEIRDCIMWHYGSGFPKSLDVSKAIDRAAGAERGRVPGPRTGGMASLNKSNASQGYRDSAYYDDGNMMLSSAPATPEAQQWSGWGTALKPATEIITMARKPLAGTVAENVLRHGTGAINVDGCRVGTDGEDFSNVKGRPLMKINNRRTDHESLNGAAQQEALRKLKELGRWPANLIHDGSDEVVGLFPEAGNGWKRNYGEEDYVGRQYNGGVFGGGGYKGGSTYCDSGSAARFFYVPKASRSDRGEGNDHPTVKPTDLMAYLCRLVTPPGGVVLDPFMGSGSTGKAAMLEGFRFIGIEREVNYFSIAESRIKEAANRPQQTQLF